MARNISPENLNLVIDAIRVKGGSARLEEISLQLGKPVPRRTLQRWLKALAETGRVEVMGQGRVTVYRIPATTPAPAAADAGTEESAIPLSISGAEILEYVRRPLGARQPVTYDRSFLDRYVPNQTSYLSASVRKHLSRMGNTGELERPAGTYGREVLNRLLIDLSWSSSRLEGNTYSQLDTRRLIEFGERAEGKDAQEARMILNHKAAIEMLVADIETVGFNPYTILNLHGLLSEDLLTDPDASGRLRQRSVDIGGSSYKPPGLPQVIDELFREMLDKASRITDPFEQSFFALVHIPYLQPFDDVNKRVSRLAVNIPLFKQNFCPLTFLGVPQRTYISGLIGVYEMTRIELLADVFVWAYERSTREYLAVRQSLSDPDPVRLRYHRQIHDLVGRLVRELNADPLAVIQEEAAKLAESHRTSFTENVTDDLKRLHEGVLARYGLRPSELEVWRSHQNRHRAN
jgi:fido (protein-threonine AMPylation protein)